MIMNRQVLLDLAPIKNMLPTKERLNGVSHGLSEAGYDIRIKQDVRFDPRRNIHSTYVPSDYHPDFCPKAFTGMFALGSTVEEFDMPVNLAGIVHDKSTWARQGLSVFNTVIEPGWKGFLTLELVYHGQDPLFIPAGSGIAQVIFHHLKVATAYNGKYQNQADKPVSSIFEKDTSK